MLYVLALYYVIWICDDNIQTITIKQSYNNKV